MPTYTLHEDPCSANCYKIKLTAALLGQALQIKQYDIRKGETRTPEFLQSISAHGRIPVLQIHFDDGSPDVFLTESNAACWYLAENAPEICLKLLPNNHLSQAQMLSWMFFEQNQHEPAIATLRFWLHVIGRGNLDETRIAQIHSKRKAGEEVLARMEQHLAGNGWWLVGDSISLADITLYAYTHRAHEAEFDLNQWPNIVKWCSNIEDLNRYVEM